VSSELGRSSRLERLLATVLHYGTYLASGVIAVGLVLGVIDQHAGAHLPAVLSSTHIVTAGIALLILLPVLRVALMLIVFAIDRDRRFVAIAALVLLIILAGFVLGMHMSPAA
jgi:uncharacterized membrane protein